jgi:hypothetical protein
LGGFRRGGAAAINAAFDLGKSGIKVKAIFLFDAVDRSFSIRNSRVADTPENVELVFHAVRLKGGNSKRTFGNIDLRSRCTTEGFKTTHGAMGGWRLNTFATRKNVTEISGSNANSTPAAVLPGKSSTVVAERVLFGTSATNITPLEQLSGSFAVWHWMEGKVRSVVGRSQTT